MLYFYPPGIPPIPYEEVCPGSPEESFMNGQGRARRMFLVDWDQRWDFCRYLLGFATIENPGTVDAWVTRKTPEPYPTPFQLRPKFSQLFAPDWMYATQIESIKGDGPQPRKPTAQDSDLGRYVKARVTILYDTLTYTVKPDEEMRSNQPDPLVAVGTTNPAEYLAPNIEGRFVTRQVQPTAEFLTLPFGAFKWVEYDPALKPVVATTTSGVLDPSMEIVYTWHMVPYISKEFDGSLARGGLPSCLRTHIGTVNNATFDNFAVGQLLITGIEVRGYRWLGGDFYHDITYKMKFRDPQWDNKAAQLALARPPSIGADSHLGNAGHNWFLRFDFASASYRYQLISTDGKLLNAGNPSGYSANPFSYQNFNRLFIPA